MVVHNKAIIKTTALVTINKLNCTMLMHSTTIDFNKVVKVFKTR